MAFDGEPRVTAVLGPTNTGKTHYAIERMLAHRTGVIGLPLRLLAREVYDRIVALRGPSVVALVTGEERIVPPRAAWWVCTVEAMPVDLGADFLAVDEIQLCADPDRGHIFTDRLLNARGLNETLFLGSDTMRGRIAHLIPGARFLSRERFSDLRYTGARKISRMPARSAIVGFSVEDVYAIAELIRRQKGGAAVVMGALSPRTRNAQVALYQNGDVDHLVATDAIGMGLNLDISHVAFSGLVKFDGRRHRHLAPAELAQIAGRAGRYMSDGTFGVTGEAGPLDPDVAEAIERHRFEPIRRLQWRNAALEYGSPAALIASLEASSGQPDLQRAREADDLLTLRALAEMPDIRGLRGPVETRLLWDVCRVPDFRKVSLQEHANLCARLHEFLREEGGIPTDWLASQIRRIDRAEGDIDTLSKRLAYIRTWTYVAQRKGWVDDTDHWREETRAVEDRLSDALHARLTQRFVDRRTSILMRRLKQREGLVATVTEDGEVTIDDQFIGRLEGFRFQLDPSASAEEARTLRAAGLAALAPALNLRADKFYNAPDTEIDVTEQGGLMWGEHAVGKLVTGGDVLSPQIEAFVEEGADPQIAEKVKRRLGHWIDRKSAALFQPLIALRDDESLSGMARGIAFRLVEALGVLPRGDVAEDVKSLDQEQRAGLRKHGVRFGQYTIFQPLMLKPAVTRLRLVLWSLSEGFDVFPEAPPPGLVTVPAVQGAPGGYYARAGYRLAGERAIRIDMLERLADMIRGLDARAGFEASADMLSITGLSLEQFAGLMRGMGYTATEGTRPKRRAPKPAEAASAGGGETPDVVPADVPGDAPAEVPADAPAEAPPDVPSETPADVPSETPPATPPEMAAAPGETPDEVPADVPAETPTEIPGDAPAETPIEEPYEAPPTTPTEDPIDPPAEVPVTPPVEEPPAETPVPDDPPVETPVPSEPPISPSAQAEEAPLESLEVESYYTFVRAPRQRPARAGQGRHHGADGAGHERRGKAGNRNQGERDGNREGNRDGNRKGGDHQGGRPKHGKGKPERKQGEQQHRPRRAERPERPVDPDNPFAALMSLKLRE
ncbi:helicase-related protein [Amaricoccus sp. W119]|uniref:helicase-related protein n=1 Tax=Amaricoccus sp. W119 TaxID=3391833 RepID=UPI0039A4F4AE